jgi:hypothetical protein
MWVNSSAPKSTPSKWCDWLYFSSASDKVTHVKKMTFFCAEIH